MNNIKFETLPPVDDISGVIEDIFGVKLDISGGWGYDNNSALEVKNLKIPQEQFFQMFSSMRANIEMNLTLEDDSRYGGINVTQLEHKEFSIENQNYDVVTFKITAMKEKDYNHYIKEYKENYGSCKFDLDKHFKGRQEATIEVQSDFWFLFN